MSGNQREDEDKDEVTPLRTFWVSEPVFGTGEGPAPGTRSWGPETALGMSTQRSPRPRLKGWQQVPAARHPPVCLVPQDHGGSKEVALQARAERGRKIWRARLQKDRTSWQKVASPAHTVPIFPFASGSERGRAATKLSIFPIKSRSCT